MQTTKSKWQRSRWLWLPGSTPRLGRRLFLLLFLLVSAVTGIEAATAYVTDVQLVGASSKTACNKLRDAAVAKGWTNAGIDLNKSVSDSWDISLFYKTAANADPDKGYITDMIATNGDKGSSMVISGRTYYKVPTNSGFDGDLNKGAGGKYIYLYYTKDRANLSTNGGTKRVMTKIEVNESTGGSPMVQWNTGGTMDANDGAGGAYVYIHMTFATQKLEITNDPQFANENLNFSGKAQYFVTKEVAGNWGTMNYKINNGSYSTTLPSATNVGNYTVYYYLDGGTYANSSDVKSKTFTIHPPVIKATFTKGTFNQAANQVELTWSVPTITGNYTGYKWKLYRDDALIATLNPGTTSYEDKTFPTDGTLTYDLYYVSNFWDADTKRDDTKATKQVTAQRSIPVNNLKAVSQSDRIVFTWTSDGYPASLGHKFKIYVDNETDPIYTLTPTDDQTSFQWEHRHTTAHENRQSKTDATTGVPYTEEPLNACTPHNYRVEGVIGSTKLNEASVSNKAIGNGTQFSDFDASKGAYPGTVKLAWHVDLGSNTSAKTYLVDRRRAEKESDPWVNLLRTSSTEEYLFYTDETPLPGVYYEYRVTVQDKCSDGTIVSTDITDIGFAQTTGTVSGRITYGSTGTSVKDADVVAEKTGSSGDDTEQFHSMRFTSTSGAVTWDYPSTTYATDKFSTGDFSIQLWIRPEAFNDNWMVRFNTPSTPEGLNSPTCVALSMLKNGQKIIFCDGRQNCDFNLAYKGGEYQHVTITRKGSEMTCYLIQYGADGLPVMTKGTAPVSETLDLSNATQFQITKLVGFVDDFRLWTKCLTEDEIMENFDHLLVGNEKGLETYWTFDEGLKSQYFDYSRDGTVYHEHHGIIGSNAGPSNVTPQYLALKAKTDKDGNYILNGIPFTGEGTTYAIKPSLGVHQFNPTQQLRYIGNNSLVHNSVDFDDVSSFAVSGTVYFENTSIPVEEAYLYVDGVMASKDGEPIMTNAQGEFTVSVPIGDHFIQVKKQGHTFLNDGRFPKDTNGTGERYTFEEDESGVNFYDQTLVTVVGRVAGGDIEYEKPLGVDQGKNNIGTATLKLVQSSPKGYLNYDKENKDIATTDRLFDAQYGEAFVPAGKEYITVKTDPVTGEWLAQLPPLRYEVTQVIIDSNQDITNADFSLPIIDASNPNVVYTDSIEAEDGGWIKCKYVASAKMEYKSKSTIELTENKDGSFGMKSYTVKDIAGVEHEVPLYLYDDQGNAILDANGKVQYTFGVTDENPNGYPVYEELSSYKYHLYAYERYVNNDGTEPVIDEVPLAGKTVTIKNQYASTTAVKLDDGTLGEMVDDQLELDDNGEATYTFMVGFPNIQSPYTRGLTITYDNGTEMPWSENGKFKVIVLGGLPTGSNFVTQGPDDLLMILRDPPGSNSQTTWSKGTTHTRTKTTTSEYNNNTGLNSTIYCGIETAQGAGVGFMVITDTKSKFNIKAGAEYTATRTSGHTTVETTTTTQDISTSDAMDFVGAVGDVFIGVSKNLIFGACNAVDIKWDNVNNKPVLLKNQAISMGEELTTSFAYDQNYIKEVLIPNFLSLRDSLLTPVTSVTDIPRPAKGEDPIYLTLLDKNDPRFGTSNTDYDVWGTDTVQIGSMTDGVYAGPSYTMLLPQDYESTQDMVNFYNTQVNKWERWLRANEEAKVTAIENRDKWLKENRSFSAGTTYTESITEENTTSKTKAQTDGFNITIGAEMGFTFTGVGVGVEVTEQNGGTWTSETQTDDVTSTTMQYTLQEDGDDDYLSVDIYNAPDAFGPIFVTRGGATSCPFEDEIVTDYYQPGTVISAKTVQIEKPEIEAQTQALTGVPAGGSGNFKVNIRNNSETGEDLWFDLLVTPDSNPDGLAVSMDDTSLNYGTTVLVKAGETMVKTITVNQTNPDVLEYKNVKIRIASQCQKDNTSTYHEIADTTEFSVFFQPSCSDIKLASSHTLVNSETETAVTLSMSGYNYTMASLKGIRLQYKGEHDADFRTLQEYSKDENRVNSDPNLLLLPALEGTSKLNYIVDLRTSDFSDNTYVFRAITVCDQGGVEVNNESEEITIIRDISLPQLIATPSPATGILTSADDLAITFNEDIQSGILTKPNNFSVVGVLNESEIIHDVALSLSATDAAQTEATMDLSGKSFTADMWVNYTTDGRLLMHGTTDNNFTVAIENGQLAVYVAGERTGSTAVLPKDKWLYLHVSYNAGEKEGDTPTVSAAYAQDATTVDLFTNVETNAYGGNGIISIGGDNLTGKVQELTIWNTNRSMAEAQSTMYNSKSQYTSGLIGYWQLNEGHGSTATDKARNRHITLPGENAWWINGTNYSLTLDGTKAATVNIGSLNTTDNEDYLLETWFKADKQQDGIASIISTPKMDLRLNAAGNLELLLGTVAETTASNVMPVLNRDLRDGQWHHLAVNVLKSANGSGNIYLDGQLCKQISGSAMPPLTGDKLMLGARRVFGGEYVPYNFIQLLKGAVDEVRIWKGRRTADVIRDNMYTRMKADEPGLVAYYPMESYVKDDYDRIVSTQTFNGQAAKNNEELGFFNPAGASSVAAVPTDLSTLSTPALKPEPKQDEVQFSFVASERQIKINLNELPAKIEGCNIYVTVKNVKDLNGNRSEAVTWGAYVQRNNLKWAENDLEVTKSGVERATFTATIENNGSETETWSLSGMPSWLSANVEGGSLMPLSSGKVTFAVDESLPIGTYEATVYMTGSKDIAVPLYVTVKSLGQVPLWSVNPADYENSMNVIGIVNLDGMPMNDEDDLLAAFIGDECRGVAHFEYLQRFDGYFVTMDIYGNDDAGKEVTFRAYDASTGTVYPAVEPQAPYSPINFEPLALKGKYADPVVFTVLDKIEQNTDLKAGWNWLSLNVTADDMSVESVFEKIAEDVYIVKTQGSGWLMYENGRWDGEMDIDYKMTNVDMYSVQMLNPRNLHVVGRRVDPSVTPVNLNKNWTWIGYYGRQLSSLGDAFTSMNPVTDDILKGQSGVAYFDGTEWLGSIRAMEPGKGYMMFNNSGSTKSFSYPSASVAGARRASEDFTTPSTRQTAADSYFTPVDYTLYSGNAIMSAQVKVGDMSIAGVELGVFADGECRATSVTNANGIAFLTIPGDDPATLTFQVAFGNEVVTADETFAFETDAVYGSPKHPVVINLSNVQGIMSIDLGQWAIDNAYDLQGRKVQFNDQGRKLRKGVYIVNGQKKVK